MGMVASILHSVKNSLFMNISGVPYEDPPISYERSDDYTIHGTLRDGVQDKWSKTLNSMIFLELTIRRMFWPIIQKRMDRMEASLKFNNCNLNYLTSKFPAWDENKMFEAHDLFQAFEVDGDGLIEIAEMSVGLDNLGDETPRKDRIPMLCKGDEDGTGSIDFEEFITILYEHQVTNEEQTTLSKTFSKVNNDIKFIRYMSTVQQIEAGFL